MVLQVQGKVICAAAFVMNSGVHRNMISAALYDWGRADLEGTKYCKKNNSCKQRDDQDQTL